MSQIEKEWMDYIDWCNREGVKPSNGNALCAYVAMKKEEEEEEISFEPYDLEEEEDYSCYLSNRDRVMINRYVDVRLGKATHKENFFNKKGGER